MKMPVPKEHEVLVRVEAAPINPSDMMLMFSFADLQGMRVSRSGEKLVLTADFPKKLMPHIESRLEQPLPVGNEGAGEIIAAGASPQAQALIGQTVGALGGMYSQYRLIDVDQ